MACNAGISSRQGGHQLAQKLTTTTFPCRSDRRIGLPSRSSSSKSGAASPTIACESANGDCDQLNTGRVGKGQISSDVTGCGVLKVVGARLGSGCSGLPVPKNNQVNRPRITPASPITPRDGLVSWRRMGMTSNSIVPADLISGCVYSFPGFYPEYLSAEIDRSGLQIEV